MTEKLEHSVQRALDLAVFLLHRTHMSQYPSSVWGLPFLHILTNTYCILSFDDSHSNRCEVILTVLFSFYFIFCLFRAIHTAYGGSQARGQIGTLTYWARPGVEPMSSWMLVRFVNLWATVGPPCVLSDWHFSDVYWCRESFLRPFGPLCVFFAKRLLRSFASF